MGKPELGQRVQLLQGVSRWLFAFLDKPRERGGNASEWNALRLDALGTYVRACMRVREEEKN